MSGISRLTALEIFTNPEDLEITIGQEKDGAKFAIGIFRGPGHNFKPMLTSQPFAITLEDAVESVKEILEGIQQAISKEFEDGGSLTSQHLNPEAREVDQSKILSAGLITRIIEELRQHRKASTYKMLTVAN